MAKKSNGPKKHAFRNKLILNQWLISLFGIDPLADRYHGNTIRPFHDLATPLKTCREGLDHDHLHHFYHTLVESELFWNDRAVLSKDTILAYDENIVRYTQTINGRRSLPVVWKYYQWLTLLFGEVYLDRFFGDKQGLLSELNGYVERFNRRWPEYVPVPAYEEDDLNKLCLQNATGSGKTLIMHINLLQYRHYAETSGRQNDLSRVILLTPNERLSEQHITEFNESGFGFVTRLEPQKAGSLGHVDVTEITKLGDREGPSTIATRSLGDQNLLLVDEGHRGMSGKEEGAWFARRAELCEKGFTFEYSATFEQAVAASKSKDFEDSYAKTIIFDYSYRWFYEDGFGKDYQILNLPSSFGDVEAKYLTACLLKFYEQLRIYQAKPKELEPFNLEKPLWVFVGSTVSKAKGGTDEEELVATDVALIIRFFADFLHEQQNARQRMREILVSTGSDTGLLDRDGNDIFYNSFEYLRKALTTGETVEGLYTDILSRLFNEPAGGHLELMRIRGESGEVALRVGVSEIPFGLINVGDAKGLCDHVEEIALQQGVPLKVVESDFTEAMFASIKDSSSPINLLIGSKKFVEGWDCWRVSTMGLMHVGKSEGSQIIQLFGRGVRLKGFGWSLKRSGHSSAIMPPPHIEQLETLNVFGIEADFMQRFRDFLKEEGLPGNERRQIHTIPLTVTYDVGKRLKTLRPKRKASDGSEYDFKKDGPVPAIGQAPDYLKKNQVVVDWYPRIQAMQSRGGTTAAAKDEVTLREKHLALLDYDVLFFELERFKREKSWHNLNISKSGIYALLNDPTWYLLRLPDARLNPPDYRGILILQQVAAELLRRYCNHYYNYCKREFIEPRLEVRDLEPGEELPEDGLYELIIDADDGQAILSILQLKKALEDGKDLLPRVSDLRACKLDKHLFQPLIHVPRGGKITVLPVVLNESEFQFVEDLKAWCMANESDLAEKSMEVFLLRNQSRGKGIGFFEAGGFYPDFILWLLVGGKQYITFVDPHGLHHEGPGSEKVLFHKRIKEVETRLGDPNVILNSFILSWTSHPQLPWGIPQDELEDQHVLFMSDDRDGYIGKLFAKLG